MKLIDRSKRVSLPETVALRNRTTFGKKGKEDGKREESVVLVQHIKYIRIKRLGAAETNRIPNQ